MSPALRNQFYKNRKYNDMDKHRSYSSRDNITVNNVSVHHPSYSFTISETLKSLIADHFQVAPFQFPLAQTPPHPYQDLL